MDWKKENPKDRYIDSITLEEAKEIAFLASGEPQDFQILDLKIDVNGNNIPHVEIHYKAFAPEIFEEYDSYVGIFHNLNVYLGKSFHAPYCQRELHEYLTKIGF